MIAHLEGRLAYKSPERVVIDVNGVGYNLFITLNTFYHLPEPEERVFLQTYTHVREDALQLYGFFNYEEKQAFELLIGVSKIGPRLARNILSGLSTQALVSAIKAGDIAAISAVPGVGRKTAERMILELRDKLGALTSDQNIQQIVSPKVLQVTQESEAVSALVNLGYKKADAQKILKTVLAEVEISSLEMLIKEALQRLA